MMSKILIVVDIQKDFVDGVLGTKEAVGIIPYVVKKIKNFNGKVIYTRDSHENNYLSTQEGKYLPVEHCIEGTEGWELCKDIQDLMEGKENIIFNKNTFGSKELVQYLVDLDKKEYIEEIELMGLCTDICVISNAISIKTFLPEVRITVDSKGSAGVTPESHQNALEAMKMCQIKIV